MSYLTNKFNFENYKNKNKNIILYYFLLLLL